MPNDEGIPNTVLLAKWCIADAINLPYLLSNLVREASGLPLLPLSHLCNSRMDQSMKYKEEQGPTFLAIRNYLTGFDLLNGCYSDSDGNLCHFELLQIVTKAKDNLIQQKGKAINADCGIFGPPAPPPSPPFFSSAGASKPPHAGHHVPQPPPGMANPQAKLEAARKERESFCAAYEEIAHQMMKNALAKDHKDDASYDTSLPDHVKSDNYDGYVSAGESDA
eukprot:7211844-Ditylum_brightwellii.AAC.1